MRKVGLISNLLKQQLLICLLMYPSFFQWIFLCILFEGCSAQRYASKCRCIMYSYIQRYSCTAFQESHQKIAHSISQANEGNHPPVWNPSLAAACCTCSCVQKTTSLVFASSGMVRTRSGYDILLIKHHMYENWSCEHSFGKMAALATTVV